MECCCLYLLYSLHLSRRSSQGALEIPSSDVSSPFPFSLVITLLVYQWYVEHFIRLPCNSSSNMSVLEHQRTIVAYYNYTNL